MEQTVLTKEQYTALDVFRAHTELARIFYLTGGTALAEWYLHHRYSEDLDFFTDNTEIPQFEIEACVEEMRNALGAPKTVYRRLYDRRIFFLPINDTELKIEFTHYPFPRLHPSRLENGVQIDSLEDISANKLMALADRIEAKDFVDLFYILTETETTMDGLRASVEKKFHTVFDPLTIGSEFAKVRTITELPRMIKPLTINGLKIFFAERAKEFERDILK